MQVRLLVGPAGSGKTFRCLEEARRSLCESPDGPPLVLVAPKQGTYQLEQQLLANSSLPGYTRLRILSFESLAHLVFDQLRKKQPRMLDEEGRLMVLRGLLTKKRSALKLFRASARLTGFAQQLSQILRELQRDNLTPEALNQLAQRVAPAAALSYKLQDLGTLLQEYLVWLKAHDLQDDDCLLCAAVEALRAIGESGAPSAKPSRAQPELFDLLEPATPAARPHISRLWVDGFAEFSEPELGLLAELTKCCDNLTITFCMDGGLKHHSSWLSPWAGVRRAFEHCQNRFKDLVKVELVLERLPTAQENNRFTGNPVLHHLESHWVEPLPYQDSVAAKSELEIAKSLRLAACADPEEEATLAAREILRFVRTGARFRDISVLVRKLELYHRPLHRVFSRYDIPFFLDRRESIAHHPAAELTRSALRTVALGWQHEDWFAALKSGLVPAAERELDRLENEALARGWRGQIWHEPIHLRTQNVAPEELDRLKRLESDLEAIRRQVVWPFEKLALASAVSQNKLTGPQLAAAIRELWQNLNVQERLQNWADSEPSSYESRARGSIHATVWMQMNTWLENLELAFPIESMALREWLPILEAGLSSMTVGSIPPSLDQVLIGAVDRSRTPEIKLALVLGLNETVFPAAPQASVLLTDTDRFELQKYNVLVASNSKSQLGGERYLAYIACTRARERTVLTCARNDGNGTPMNPSPFLSHIRELFPSLAIEDVPKLSDWRESEHVHELLGSLLAQDSQDRSGDSGDMKTASLLGDQNAASSGEGLGARFPHPVFRLEALPGAGEVIDRVRDFRHPDFNETLDPELASQLYGPVLRSSVSRLEQFAACPFRFFVHSGLRAQERQRFELDVKEQGSFQHDVLAAFHQQLAAQQKRWRDVTPTEARERIANIARNLMASYRDGLLDTTAETRFLARVMTETLQDFIEILVGWMRDQYRFEPVRVELPFGEDQNSPPWVVDLDKFHLELYGRIDRVDLYREPGGESALCVVVDYKSSQKQLDSVFIAHGLQLQLLTYLNVLRRWPNSRAFFDVEHLVPAGVFYVNLRGKYPRASNRLDAFAGADRDRKLAYRHYGRFDLRALPLLDSRAQEREGDQFNYRLTDAREIHRNCREPMPTSEFEAMLDGVEVTLKSMGKRIYAGAAEVAPFRKGAVTACEQCGYRSICRIDPWTHAYRVLANGAAATPKYGNRGLTAR